MSRWILKLIAIALIIVSFYSIYTYSLSSILHQNNSAATGSIAGRYESISLSEDILLLKSKHKPVVTKVTVPTPQLTPIPVQTYIPTTPTPTPVNTQISTPKPTATPKPTLAPGPTLIPYPAPTQSPDTKHTPETTQTQSPAPVYTPYPTLTSSPAPISTPIYIPASTPTPILTPVKTSIPNISPTPTSVLTSAPSPTYTQSSIQPADTLIPISSPASTQISPVSAPTSTPTQKSAKKHTPSSTPSSVPTPDPALTQNSTPVQTLTLISTPTPIPTSNTTSILTPLPTQTSTTAPVQTPALTSSPASTSIPPEIIADLAVAPESQTINSTVDINYKIYKAGNISLDITYPNGTTEEIFKDNISVAPYYNTIQFNVTQFGEYTAKVSVQDQDGNISYTSTNFYGIEVITNSTKIPAGNKIPVIIHKDIVIEVTADEGADAKVGLIVKLAPSNRSVNASQPKDAIATKYIEIKPVAAEHISNITLKVNYTSEEINGLDENTLGLYYLDDMNNSWYRIRDYTGEVIPGGPYVYDAGVDTAAMYAWADLNHFSIFAFGGTPPAGTPSSHTSTASNSDESNPSNGGSSSPGGGSSGGGGGTSGEDYKNLEKIEKYEKNLYKDISTSYQFTQNGLVEFVNITGNINADSVGVITEVLHNTSSFVNVPAPGTVYRNVNIWVGDKGFAVPHNIKEGTITFRVKKAWLDENNINEVIMYRYSDGEWTALPTINLQETGEGFVRYRATTDSFSPFAISGVKKEDSTALPAQQADISQPRATPRPTETAHTSTDDWGNTLTLALIGIVAAALLFFRKQMM